MKQRFNSIESVAADLHKGRMVIVVDDADRPGPATRLPGAVVLVDQPGLTVYRLPG